MEKWIEHVWVPGAFIPGYDDYCPIVPQDVYADDHFVYLDEIEVPRERIIANPGFLVLEINEIYSEHTITRAAEAVAKSIESLFAACSPNVQHYRVATAVELKNLVDNEWSHIIIIGHGTENGFNLLDREEALNGKELADLFQSPSNNFSHQIISLCCWSGCANVSRSLSEINNVSEVIAPSNQFDLRWAVVFVTGYLLKLFESTDTMESAVREAATWSLGSEMPICIWRDGKEVNIGSDKI